MIRRHRNTPWAACADMMWKRGAFRAFGKPKILELRPWRPPAPEEKPDTPPDKGRPGA